MITQSISGLGGVGKTQLAARYVHDHAQEYDVVAWISAEDGGVSDLAALASDSESLWTAFRPPTASTSRCGG